MKDETIRLYEYLGRRFSRVKIVYSSRGFHIHVFDDAYKLGVTEREALARDVKARGFHIDTWVTVGDMRLIRLPYGLNGLVSRIMIPLDKSEIQPFDPSNDQRCVPKFLDIQLRS